MMDGWWTYNESVAQAQAIVQEINEIAGFSLVHETCREPDDWLVERWLLHNRGSSYSSSDYVRRLLKHYVWRVGNTGASCSMAANVWHAPLEDAAGQIKEESSPKGMPGHDNSDMCIERLKLIRETVRAMAEGLQKRSE